MTGQWRMQPLPFGVLRTFLPGWPADQLIAVYAMVGGVPAYLAWFHADRSLMENVCDGMLAPGSLAMNSLPLMTSDLAADRRRETRVYHRRQLLANAATLGPGSAQFEFT